MTDQKKNDNNSATIGKMMPIDKAWMVTGRDFWRTSALPRFAVRSLMMSDGPHGLRLNEPEKEHLPFEEGLKATCFPPACTIACSWDKGLLLQIGRALAAECKGKIDILLGPGINIKRSPLGGRNFEYFSEDPYLTGQLASAWIEGLQSDNIGACLKHFAVNSQETRRMIVNAIVDKRALHEIYLSAFEHVIRKARPWSIMASYNMINGSYACENKYLLSTVLREKWKFDGVVISDWGAVNDRLAALEAGMDLEMPGSGSFHVKEICCALKKKKLESKYLDDSVKRLLALHDRADGKLSKPVDNFEEDHHYLALRAAEQSMVLTKNEKKILPLKARYRIAVIGDFAIDPRYQGHGSSRVNPTRVDNLFDSLIDLDCNAVFSRGYDQSSDDIDQELLAEAMENAGSSDVAVVCLGLPDKDESEGYDRPHMQLPANQLALMEKLWTVQPRIVVVYFGGSPVELPFINRASAVLLSYLGGQAGGQAIARILLGLANPGGKLAESWPVTLDDTPCVNYFPGTGNQVEYRESIYVGYRYYQTVQKPVLWPFGFGLSYSKFDWFNLALDRSVITKKEPLQVTCYLRNSSSIAGSEVVQVYVSDTDPATDRPALELKAFAKVFLEPAETKMISFSLDWQAFARFDPDHDCQVVDDGTYEISVGSSCQDIWLKSTVVFENEDKDKIDNLEEKTKMLSAKKRSYTIYDRIVSGHMHPEDFENGKLVITKADFVRRYGSDLPEVSLANEKIHLNTLISDLGEGKLARKMMFEIFSGLQKAFGDPAAGTVQERQLIAQWEQTPLRSIALLGGKEMNLYKMKAIISMLNGRIIRGTLRLVSINLIDKLDEVSKKD